MCLSINKDDVARSKRDVYYCNLAACLQQMGRDQEAVDACSQAIEASPKYIKAYMRRGQTLEKMEKFQGRDQRHDVRAGDRAGQRPGEEAEGAAGEVRGAEDGEARRRPWTS